MLPTIANDTVTLYQQIYEKRRGTSVCTGYDEVGVVMTPVSLQPRVIDGSTDARENGNEVATLYYDSRSSVTPLVGDRIKDSNGRVFTVTSSHAFYRSATSLLDYGKCEVAVYNG